MEWIFFVNIKFTFEILKKVDVFFNYFSFCDGDQINFQKISSKKYKGFSI